MRIPFIPKFAAVDVDAELQERAAFITASRGGCTFLFAGALFWTIAGLVGIVAPEAISQRVYLYGGISVPVVGFLLGRALQASLPTQSRYGSLVMFASMMTVICLPLLPALEDRAPDLIAPALTIIDGAHLPILMWLHLDYSYSLAACAKIVVGLIFIHILPEYTLIGTGLASGVISLATGFFVLHASRDPLRAYLTTPGG